MPPLPIIFIHQGPCRYLAGTITQARQANPLSEIVLLGDRQNAGFLEVRHFQATDFAADARAFQNIYRHRSSHEVEYELFCFQRWFVLRSFLQAQGWDACLYLDSDVLLYSDATRLAQRFLDFDLTPSHTSPHCMFINRRAALDRFCDFLTECYTNPKLWSRLEEHYAKLQASGLPGGVCDMTAFGLFDELGRGKIADLYAPRDEGVFDHSINDPNGFAMRQGIKRMEWREGYPHGQRESEGAWLRFHTLHFQGNSKRFLRAHVKLASPRLRFTYQLNRLIAEKGKLLRKWTRASARKRPENA